MIPIPFRLDPDKFPNRAKIQFVTFAQMPRLIYKACLATGLSSNTVYIQRAVCEALARDLGLDLDKLLADLPANRSNSRSPVHKLAHENIPGQGNTIEEVR